MAKQVSMRKLDRKKFKLFEFTGDWLASFGKPEKGSHILIYGESGHGKTEFCAKLAKYMSTFAKVLYVSAEQGESSSLQGCFRRNGLTGIRKIALAVDYTFNDLVDECDRKGSAEIIVLDSIDYINMTLEQQKLLKEEYPTKTFVFVSWADGKKPMSKAGVKIEFRADVKIRVENFVAFVRSRYGGNEPYIIWLDKAKGKHSFLNKGGYDYDALETESI